MARMKYQLKEKGPFFTHTKTGRLKNETYEQSRFSNMIWIQTEQQTQILLCVFKNVRFYFYILNILRI